MKEIGRILGRLPDRGSSFIREGDVMEVRTVRGFNPGAGEPVELICQKVRHPDGSSEETYTLTQGTKGVIFGDKGVIKTEGFNHDKLTGKKLEQSQQLAALELVEAFAACDPKRDQYVVFEKPDLHAPVPTDAGIVNTGILVDGD